MRRRSAVGLESVVGPCTATHDAAEIAYGRLSWCDTTYRTYVGSKAMIGSLDSTAALFLLIDVCITSEECQASAAHKLQWKHSYAFNRILGPCQPFKN